MNDIGIFEPAGVAPDISRHERHHRKQGVTLVHNDPGLNRIFISQLRSLLSHEVQVVEVDAHINDEVCAQVAVDELLRQFEG